MKEWQRTIILVIFIAILIALFIWARQLPESTLT
jgi:hypothetical protein